MVIQTERKEIVGGENIVTDSQYFGNSVYNSDLPSYIKDDFKENQGRSCITSKNVEGIIIGFEDSNSFNDYYWIVYGSDGKLYYELYNDAEFYKKLK